MNAFAILSLSSTALSSFTPTPWLPPLLEFTNGSAVTSLAAWRDRRVELKQLLSKYVLGTMPSTPPELLSATSVNKTSMGHYGTSTSEFIELVFNTSGGSGNIPTVSFVIEVLAPVGDGGNVLLPVLMTQWNHRAWALAALSRGYIGVVYPGADARDISPDFQRAYAPAATMALISARAFVASRAVDFLRSTHATQEYPIDAARIGITGHSRNGKQSLIAAAFDERISAVVGSSPGAPIASPYRFTSSNFYGEGPTTGGVAGKWWLASIINYTGHPENMPIDGHAILALIAPRPVVVATGHNDDASDMVYANEMSMRANAPVFGAPFFGAQTAPTNLRFMRRPGCHHGFDDVQTYLDWFDVKMPAAAVSASASASLLPPCRGCWYTEPEDLSTYLTAAGFDWQTWAATQPASSSTPPPTTAPLQKRVEWLLSLGPASGPPGFTSLSPGDGYGEEAEGAYTTPMLHHDQVSPDVARVAVSFGDYLSANVYFPASAKVGTGSPALPAVVWLHPYAYNNGYAPMYRQSRVWEDLAREGAVVFAFELVGFGLRNPQGGAGFYARQPRASMLGDMVKDVRSALDFLHCRSAAGRTSDDACFDFGFTEASMNRKLPVVDEKRIALLGYALGGNVALHAGALDSRPAAIGAFAAWTPFRTDVESKPTGGLRRLYEMHALLPKLGYFAGKESEVPYDMDELIGSLAPRDVLIYAPTHDRDATFADVERALAVAAKAWPEASGNGAGALEVETPDDYSRMESAQAKVAVSWVQKVLQLGH